MKQNLFILLTVATFWVSDRNVFATDTNGVAIDTNSISADAKAVTADLNQLILKINTKLKAGRTNEADFADNLKEFDVLLAKYKDVKTPYVVEIPRMKAEFYLAVMNDPEKAVEVFKEIKRDFPGVQINGDTDAAIVYLERMASVQKLQRTLVEGAPFPDFNEKDTADKPLSVANYRGKVVLLDFWATWCLPCRMELPNVIALYDQYHDQGFEVIGVNLDEDPQQLESFIKKQKMPWPEYNDGKFWDTKLVLQYGVTQIPATFLIDRKGNIIARDLRGEGLKQAVARALANK
jgi:peroxiredoxin